MHHLADAAGEILRRAFRTDMAVENKADASPVTQADREVEAALRQLIEAAYPEHGIIGEEFGNVARASLQWVLDPIDGTQAFIAGQPTFTTLIALAKDGIPILGLIDQPMAKERWLGITGEKTTLNGVPVHTRNCTTLGQATLGTTAMEILYARTGQGFRTIEKHLRPSDIRRRWVSLCPICFRKKRYRR